MMDFEYLGEDAVVDVDVYEPETYVELVWTTATETVPQLMNHALDSATFYAEQLHVAAAERLEKVQNDVRHGVVLVRELIGV